MPNAVDQLLNDRARPRLAAGVFLAAFLFAGIPFALNSDHILVVTPCAIACFTCVILFLRLLIGELGIIKWILLGLGAFLCVLGGREWYLGALLTVGTILCSILADRAMQPYAPLVRVPRT